MSLLRTAALLLPFLVAPVAQAALPPGITGAWFNPEQSGHGLTVEIIAPGHALVVWHAFDRSGNPITLYMDGPINGRSIEATVYAPRGMRFGEFNPADLQLPVWGEIEIVFSSCDAGELNWRALDSAFGSGRTSLRRLTSVNGLACEFAEQEAAAFGMRVQRSHSGSEGSGYAAIDETGKLWAVEVIPHGLPDSVPAPGFVGNAHNARLQAQPRPGRTPEIKRQAMDSVRITDLDLQVSARGGSLHLSLLDRGTEAWTFSPNGTALVAPLRAADLARNWTVSARDQFFDRSFALRIESDGSFCYDFGGDCTMRGRLDFHRAQSGFFDFVVYNVNSLHQPDTLGRGWLQGSGANQRLIMVGDNGFGVIAR